MTAHVSGPGATPSHRQVSQHHGSLPAAIGEWNGLKVEAPDSPESLIADAAADASLSAEETDEKDVGDRKKADKNKKGGRVVRVVPPANAMEQMKKRHADRLAKLLAMFRSSMGNPAALRRALDEGFLDPTERHFALCWLESQLENQPSLAATVRREREGLEAESAVEIQAGYNIDGVEADGVGGAEAGRETYRRTVLGHAGLGQMLEDVLSRAGSEDFPATVDFLRRAVGADLSAATPSTDKRELESLNNDLYHLRAIANFTRDFSASIGKLREAGGKPAIPRAGIETLRLFAKAKDERLIMLDPLKSVLALEGGKDATYDVQALTRAWRLAHQLPAKLFSDEEARRRLLDAGQKMLDSAVDLEEALLAEGE